MAKQRVSELAKELGLKSKDLITLCESHNITGKVAQSSLDENEAAIIRGSVKGSAAQPAAHQEAAKSASVENRTEASAAEHEEHKKKKNIIFVSNPHNSKMPGGSQNSGNQSYGNRNQNQSHGQNDRRQGSGMQQRPAGSNQGRPAAAASKPIRPLTPPSPTPAVTMVKSMPTPQKPAAKPEQAAVQNIEHTAGADNASVMPAQTPAQTSAPAQTTASAANTVNTANTAGTANPVNSANTDRGYQNNRPQGQSNYQGSRPQGQSNYQGNRPQGQSNYQGNRPQGQSSGYQGNRPQGQSSYQGNRPQGQGTGYQGNRPQGQGSGYQGNRPQGQSSGYQGNRPQGQGGYQGNRPQGQGSSYGQTRQGGQGYGNGAQRPAYRQDGQRNADGSNRGGFSRPGQGRPGGYGSQGGQRPYNNNERSGRPDGGQDSRFGRKPQSGAKTAAPEGTFKDQEKHRDEEKRRIAAEKDKRNKKDLIYEEEAEVTKKAGRFIKPEKKVEEVEEQIKVITLPDTLTIKELADKMKLQPSAIVKKLFLEGKVVTVNQEITYEQAEEIAIDYEIICEKEVKVDVIAELLKEDEEDEAEMVKRPPVICIMGHVDHGKTSLLDAIRKTNVTDREAGGITQAIGAYTVNVNDQKITFLDTPGHEAFTAMRMRGANATDIAVLVVAADDGVMPQTVEAINHAKAAGIEIIVAVNKVDKPNANIDRVKQELTEYELIPVDWGGTTEFVPVSAKTGTGIQDLLETILLTADILELKANPTRQARGLVIEAELDKGRGPVATILVQKGTLHVGDFISAGASHGKVRAMIDDKGRRVKEATPSTPVEILGLSDVPNAGEIFISHNNDKEAKSYADTFVAQNKVKLLEDTKAKMSLDDLFTQIQAGNLKELNIIIKADVQGSVEAVKQSLVKLSNEEVVVKVIHGGVGAINESDVSLASASSAIIIGFNVRPDVQAKITAEREGVDVRLYKVIYQAIEDVEAAMKGMLDPVFEEKIIGHAEVRQIFKASAIGNIAGSYVMDGNFQRGCKVRVTREGKQIFEGDLASLKRFKDDVKEVKEGFECGLVFDGFDQMQELDMVEAYIMVEVPR